MITTDAEKRYIEEVALYFESRGMTRSAGRILGVFLIAEVSHYSMPDLVEILQMSKSSMSTALRSLIQTGLIERFSLPGERRDYYRMQDRIWDLAFRDRTAKMRAGRELAARGLALLADEPTSRRRQLQEMHDLLAFLEREWPLLLARWAEERAKNQNHE